MTLSRVVKLKSAYDSFSEKISFTTQPKEYTSAGLFAIPSCISSGAILVVISCQLQYKAGVPEVTLNP